ncbi:ABC-type sugar transport system ATPase subunit [Rhodoligotrophos appendicifer]|uniref:ABC transporter ATP-binding protein n=1 Tax=Rhodoligotrophos appendicifer TaxID=987056 RepID=UPI0011810380|nr:sn-glycerol-3-phosphate ABC transporter ATP-binding protein UgpC [Rhodoligotrophos appendicifer]
MADVTFRRVSKSFGATNVIPELDLTIHSGDFTVLLGPSGCGKTTLLRMVAGLEDPTSGDIAIGDRVVTALRPSERDIAMVFQSYALYPHLTVGENLAFPLKVKKVPKAERVRQVEKVSRLLGLDRLLDRKPKQLSGGQRQRVALGRAMVREPDVFLFDEPLSNLDASMREEMRSELIRFHEQQGKTVIYVTHDQIEAMTMAQRIVVMREGRIQQIGTPREVYKTPANSFVARFIGSPGMNLLTFQTDASQITIGGAPAQFNGGCEIPRLAKFILGCRPEDLRLSALPDPGVSFPTRVVALQPLGASLLVDLETAPGGVRLVAIVEWREPMPEPGATLTVFAPKESLSFFDVETEARLVA